MRLKNISIMTGLGLVGAALVTAAGHTAPLPMLSAQHGQGLPVMPAGDKEKIIGGAIVGGAIGAILGTAIGAQGAPPPPAAYPPPPAVYAPPPPAYAVPPPPVVEDEAPPPPRVVVRRRPAREVVEEIDEPEAAPQVVEERECVTRETKVYDPNTGRTIRRKERECE